MFAEKGDGKAFGACDCVGLVGIEAWDYCESADVGQMLLKFIFGSAFHSNESSPAKVHRSIGLAGATHFTTSNIFAESE